MENAKDLAAATMAQIEMHPERWSQSNWRCETGMCFAGTMADISSEVNWLNENPNGVDSDKVVDSDGNIYTVDEWACDKLDLADYDESIWRGDEHLFSMDNNMDDLRAGVKAYINDEDVEAAIRVERNERGTL